MGTKFFRPPSRRILPFHSTGVKIPGIEQLAWTAIPSSPSLKTTSSPVAISTATAA